MTSPYPVKRKAPEKYVTEFDILKSAHRFLRDENDPESSKTWDAQLAKKYEDSLFKEFAVCDLKHFKSGNVALRWRTEDEVLAGAGENTCGNTRCPYYEAPEKEQPKLTTLELPFAYTEQGEQEQRQVMVKVTLCPRCVKKLMWKREQDKKAASAVRTSETGTEDKQSYDKGEGSSKTRREKRITREKPRHQSQPHSRSKSPPRRR